MTRTVEPREWRKDGLAWVAETDDGMSYKMVVRTGYGALVASVQDRDSCGIVSSTTKWGGFKSVEAAKAWCDNEWLMGHSPSAKVRRLKRRMAALQRELGEAQRMLADA